MKLCANRHVCNFMLCILLLTDVGVLKSYYIKTIFVGSSVLPETSSYVQEESF